MRCMALYRSTWTTHTTVLHVSMLYVGPPLLDAAPLRDTAMTVCERSKNILCIGFQTGSQHR